MSVNALNVTQESLLEQINVWLTTLSSMRRHGPQNYRKSGDFVRQAHDLLRLLELPNLPREPAEPADGWTIDRQIQALENVRLFLQPDDAPAEQSEPVSANDPNEIPAEYRDLGKRNGEPVADDGGTKPKRKKAGRRTKREESGEIRVRGALVDWHKYEQGSIGRDDPAALTELAEIAECDESTVSRWLKKKFGCYEQYKTACIRDTLAGKLAFWLGEFTDEHIRQLKPAEPDDE